VRVRQKLGDVLVGAGAIDRAGLAQALAAQHSDRSKRRIGEIIVDLGLTSEERIREALAQALQMPVVDLERESPQADAVATVTRQVALSAMILPLRIERTGNRRMLVICMADPTDLQAVDNLQFKLGMVVRPLLATSSQLRRGIERAYDAPAASPPALVAPRAGGRPPNEAASWATRTPPVPTSPSVTGMAPEADEHGAARTPATAGHPDVTVELRIVGGPRDGMHVPLPPGGSLVFGRGAECDVVVPDMFLSRRHFRVTRGGAQLELLDLGSSNGTLVNGHPVSTVAVKDSDRIQLGRTVVVVCIARR
jgi:hypothetical protein